MLLITIGCISIIITACILKKYTYDLSRFESELLPASPNNENDASLSYEAIKQALENKQDIDK